MQGAQRVKIYLIYGFYDIESLLRISGHIVLNLERKIYQRLNAFQINNHPV